MRFHNHQQTMKKHIIGVEKNSFNEQEKKIQVSNWEKMFPTYSLPTIEQSCSWSWRPNVMLKWSKKPVPGHDEVFCLYQPPSHQERGVSGQEISLHARAAIMR